MSSRDHDPTTGDAQQRPAKAALTPDNMTKDERSCLVYLESCAVDGGGLVEAIRMNTEDFAAVEVFKAAGLVEFNRIPARILRTGGKRSWSHITTLLPAGWALAHLCRQRRAQRRGPHATEALEIINERASAQRPRTGDDDAPGTSTNPTKTGDRG